MGLRLGNIANLRFVASLMLAMIALTACGILGTPEEESITFEGAPEVIIASPVDGDTYREGVGINILLRVDNAGSDIARVAIEVDGEIIGEMLTPNADGAPSFNVENGWPATGIGEHTITAIAYRTDSSVNGSDSVTINVVASADSETDSDSTDDTDDETTSDNDSDTASEQVAPTATNQPLPTAVPTRTPEPTEPPATNTPSAPQVRVTTGANIRRGPGIVFDPPIGSLAAGATAEILAVNPSGTWYKIVYYNGDGWISAQTVEVIGDTSGLPREAGPATPIPFTDTPVATNTPATAPDLSVTNVVVNPHPFVCNQSSEIQITVVNNGTAASAGTGIRVEDIYNGSVTESTTGAVPPLNPGQSAVAQVFLTVSTNFAEAHNTRITVDPNNQVAESNEGNNIRNEPPYVLATGGC